MYKEESLSGLESCCRMKYSQTIRKEEMSWGGTESPDFRKSSDRSFLLEE